MSNVQLRPMSIGRILDRSFHMYRKHFVKLSLIMLILYGPYYFIQSLLLANQETASNSFFEGLRSGSSMEDVLNSIADSSAAMDGGMGLWQGLVFALVLIPLLMLVVAPISVASIVHIVKAQLLGEEELSVGAALKRSFSRFWPLVGSTVLFMMILFGLYLAFFIFLMVVVVIFSFGAGLSGAIGGIDGGAGLAVTAVILFGLLLLGFLVAWAYFIIRWCYCLPVVAMREDLLGLGQSWKLTRKSFWRLFGMYVVLTLILYLFIAVVALLIGALAGSGLLSQLLQSLVSILVMPLWLLPYAISFFDLKVRNEGLGLEDMINRTVQVQGAGAAGPDVLAAPAASAAPDVPDAAAAPAEQQESQAAGDSADAESASRAAEPEDASAAEDSLPPASPGIDLNKKDE